MAKVLKGKSVSDSIKEDLKARIEALRKKSISPNLRLIRLGENPDDIWYEKSLIKNSQALGIEAQAIVLDRSSSQVDLIKEIEALNQDDQVHGIMVFRPLPDHIDDKEVALAIDYMKDVDAMSPINIGKTFEHDDESMVPCTAQAVIELLKFYDIEIESKVVTIIGRSQVVGRPLGNLFLNNHATVSICHSKTDDLKSHTLASDIVVSAVGRAKAFDDSYFNPEAVVVDVGVNSDEDGKMVGDVDYDLVVDKVSAITPVPGGVGTITTSLLLGQVVKACENLTNK